MNGCEHQRVYYRNYLVGGPLERRCQACNELLPLNPTIADLEHQLSDEKARINCATRGGWLSEDLECAGEDDPACYTHLLAEAQRKIEKYELFLHELRDRTYRAPELFSTNEVATYAHQLGVEADRILRFEEGK